MHTKSLTIAEIINKIEYWVVSFMGISLILFVYWLIFLPSSPLAYKPIDAEIAIAINIDEKFEV